jgi:ESF2/ABP1 family protein
MNDLRKEAQKYKESLEKRGVIYLSRIPPFMKPNKARSLFEPYGEITRLYLSEEGSQANFLNIYSKFNTIFNINLCIDSSVRKKRKENGGNGSKQFSEGKKCFHFHLFFFYSKYFSKLERLDRVF